MGFNLNTVTAIEQECAKASEQGKVEAYQIDLAKDYPEPRFTLKYEGVGTIPLGDIQAIKAKSKNGKTFLCSVLIASILGCKEFGLECQIYNAKVVYVDTEQNERNTAKVARRVHTLMKWSIKENNDNFGCYSLRTMETSQRLPFIQKVIKEKQPQVLFIDGIADLIENFNDVEQSSDLINELMRLSGENDCAIVCVLHTNKAKDDSGMKGHLGTMLLQKASDVFEVKKVDHTFNVTQTDCRNTPISDFAFSIDGHGIPYKAATAMDVQGQRRLDNIKKIVNESFQTTDELTYTELVERYQLNGAVSVATAKRAVATAKENDIIEVIPNGKYKVSLSG
ncbi:MAG: AAA family ATPase [Prevotella sp.]|jgi:archaellum biogenesis ATPase FlaH